MFRQSAFTIQDELAFIRELGNWSKDPGRVPHSTLIAGYVRGVRRRTIGFDEDGNPMTKEQLHHINSEVLALCRRLGLAPTFDHVALAGIH